MTSNLPYRTIRMFLLSLSLLFFGCAVTWTDAIRQGSIAQEAFQATIPVAIQKGLVFVPVTINGETYRFLFDSGAPLSISNQLQQQNRYNIISKGNIIDSDQNRKAVEWVRIDSLKIGDIQFSDQTAFIGDFEANPLLKCLEIDGIIGSNLQRQCNWVLNPLEPSLQLTNHSETKPSGKYFSVPFRTDFQYNLFVDLAMDSITIRNVLVDFGSNGPISISPEIFSLLKNEAMIQKTFTEIGVQQSGIVGTPKELRREYSYSDKLSLSGMPLDTTLIRTGETVSIGTGVLNQYEVRIDWGSRHLYFTPIAKAATSNSLWDFRLGYSETKGLYVQSVIEGSDAYQKGLRPNMKVLKVDDLDFEKEVDFCKYVDHELGASVYLQVLDFENRKQEFQLKKSND